MNRLITIVMASAVLLTTACGVTTEDEPQLIEDSTSQSPAATPSVDSETGPIPQPTASSSSVTPTPSAPERPAGLRDPGDFHRPA